MILFLSLIFGLSAAESGLEERVAAYWDLLVGRDKAAAFEYVARDSRNAFIDRREPAMRSWRLLGIEERSESKALVTVEIEQAFPGVTGFHPVRMIEAWVKEEGQWRAVVKGVDPSRVFNQFQARKPPVPEPGRLRVVPDVMRIHFLDRLQTGGVRLANGLDEPVRLEAIEFDRLLFRLKEGPAEVAPSAYGQIVLEYVGTEIAKDRPSLMTITTLVGERRRTFEVPILYNYLSPGARALFGLTEERAEKLKRGDPLRPAIPTPGAAQIPEELKEVLEKPRPPGRD